MKLKLNGIDVDCVIGDLPDERGRTQRLRVDVELEIGEEAAGSDDLADTVDYAALVARIRAALIAAKCRLVERAARVVCDVCRSERGVRAARVSVVKAGVLPGLESAEAVIEAKAP